MHFHTKSHMQVLAAERHGAFCELHSLSEETRELFDWEPCEDTRTKRALTLFALFLTVAVAVAVVLTMVAGAGSAYSMPVSEATLSATKAISAKSSAGVGAAAMSSVAISALIGGALLHKHLRKLRVRAL